MIETGITPDFITIDGAEGGTGAAPPEFSNSVGMPMAEGLTLANAMLIGGGLRDKVKLIAAGKVLTGNLVEGSSLLAQESQVLLATVQSFFWIPKHLPSPSSRAPCPPRLFDHSYSSSRS